MQQGVKKHLQAGRVLINNSYRNRIVKAPMCDFLHECPFKGLGSLPKFLDLTLTTKLTPRCIKSEKIWLPTASCSGKIWLPTASCSSKIWLPAGRCSREILLPAAWCKGKISATVIYLTRHCIMQWRDLTPHSKMQWWDLTPRCIMQQRDLTTRSSCSGESNFNSDNSTNFKSHLKKK
jgi:hypothetical protein